MIINNAISSDTITAISTGRGGAVSIIRISGDKSIEITDSIFRPLIKKSILSQKGFSIHYGAIFNDNNEQIDDVLVSLFRNPQSYTGEDMIEISCHASNYILGTILQLILSKGARMADAGEFTLRAYCNGKMDLVQAESVADLIASDSAASHKLATNQMRGGYSKEFTLLRAQLLNIMSLMELELDFGEEEVEFADLDRLTILLKAIREKIEYLTNSFAKGNAIKKGVPVAIVGRPNAGKSTLLNALLRDDRAIVSDIAGTTRDIIEESIVLGGVQFRFIDTAGIRQTDDKLESLGIERTMRAITGADVILLVIDASDDINLIKSQIAAINLDSVQHLVLVLNKCDIDNFSNKFSDLSDFMSFMISAKDNIGINDLELYLSSLYEIENLGEDSVIISNMRHYDLLMSAKESIIRCEDGLKIGLPTDLLAQELRETTHLVGALTGDISTDEILGNIFKNFCIGK